MIQTSGISNSIDIDAQTRQVMQEIQQFKGLLDEFQGKLEIKTTLQEEIMYNKYMGYFFEEKQQITQESQDFFKQYQFMFLIGNSRVGKSTIFHLLRGDELEENEDDNYDVRGSVQTLIGQEGSSHTKRFNIFHNPEAKFIIIDTPGFNDTKENLQEAVSQFSLIKAMNKCQNLLIFVVAEFKPSNDVDLQETMKNVYNLFQNQNHFKQNEKNIRLIITKVDKKKMLQLMEKSFENIQATNPDFEENGLFQFFKGNLEQILFFKKNDKCETQFDLRNKIIEIIVKSQLRAQQNFQFQLTLSERGQKVVRIFLSNIQKFFSYKLEIQLNQLIQEAEKRFKNPQQTSKSFFFGIFLKNSIDILNDHNLKAKLNIYQNLLNFAKDRILLKKAHKLIKVIQELAKEYNLTKCLDSELIEAKFLYEKQLIGPMLDLDSKNDEFQLREIQIEKAWHNLNQKAFETTNELIQLYQADSLVKQVEINSIVKSLNKFTKETQYNWNKTVIVIGNRLSGKSKFINLIYGEDGSQVNEVITQENHLIELRRKKGLDYQNNFSNIDENYIQTKKIRGDIVIEFQNFCNQLIPLAQYFLSQSCQFKKPFVFVLVLSNIENNIKQNFKNYLIEAAENFLKTNLQIMKWNIRVIFNNKDNSELHCLLPNETFDQQLQSQIKFGCIENGIIDNPKILQESLETISNFEIKKQYPYCELFKYISDCAILQLQKSFTENTNIWQYSGKDQEILSLIQLSKLTVKSSNFQFYLTLLSKQYQVKEPIGDNYEVLFEFHKKLISENKLIDKLLKAKKDANDVKNKLENLCKNCHQFYSDDLLNSFLALENLLSIFPVYFELNQSLKNLIKVMTVVARAIYEQEQNQKQVYKSFYYKICICRKAARFNPLLNLIWNLLQMVNEDIKSQKYLLNLMQQTQTSYFKYGGQFLKKIYYRIFSESEEKVQKNQSKILELQKQYEKIEFCDNFEVLAYKQAWQI